MYLPWNVPVEALGQTLVFGEVESGDEAIVPRDIEGERAGIGVGDRDGDSDGDGMTSGGSIDSTRVNEALLAVKSQYTRYNRRVQDNDLPVSSGPPIHPAEHPNGLITRRRRRRRIKFVPIKVNTARKDETTYHGHTSAAQPPVIDSKRAYRVIGLRRRRSRMKIEPARLKIEHLNDKKQQNGEITYLGRMEIAQPPANDAKHLNKAVGPGPRCDRMKIEPVKVKIKRINVNQTLKVEKTYLGRTNAMQPPANIPKCLRRVHTPCRRRQRIKSRSTNVSRTGNGGSAYLKCVLAIWSIRRPKKDKRRLDGLTFESRMPGEPWREVEDHG